MGVSTLNRNYMMGLELFDKGMFKEAIEAFRAALSELDRSSSEVRLARFYIGQAHAALAEECLRNGAVDAAEDHLRKAIDLNPNFPDIRFSLAQVLTERGVFQEAMLELETALEINSEYAKAMMLLGVLAYQSGEFEPGAAHIERAAEIELRYATDILDQGMSAHRLGQHRKALARFIELSITDVDEITHYLNSGKASYRAGEYEAAVESFKQAVEIQGNYPDIHNWLGLALLGCQRFNEALERFSIALKINPSFAAAVINAGITCDMVDRKDEAKTYYLKAIEIDPDNLEARERLSRTLT